MRYAGFINRTVRFSPIASGGAGSPFQWQIASGQPDVSALVGLGIVSATNDYIGFKRTGWWQIDIGVLNTGAGTSRQDVTLLRHDYPTYAGVTLEFSLGTTTPDGYARHHFHLRAFFTATTTNTSGIRCTAGGVPYAGAPYAVDGWSQCFVTYLGN